MALAITHAFSSPTADNPGKEVSSGEWNAVHSITLAADRVVGVSTAGAAGEITCTAAGRALLDDATITAQRATLAAEAAWNWGLLFSVSGNALTIALKTAAGSDPSSAAPVYVKFRDVTAATPTVTTLEVTAATSLVISSGSTLGVVNASVAFRVWVVAFNDAGTFRLGAMVARTDDTTYRLYPLRGWGIASATAEGGAGTADGSRIFYAGSAVSLKPFTVLGWASWETGLGTPGTWSSAPTRAQVWKPGDPLPGERLHNTGLTSATGTSTTSTSYVTGLTAAIIPSSAANLVDAQFTGAHYTSNGASAYLRFCRTSTSTMIGSESEVFGGTGVIGGGYLNARDQPNSSASVNYIVCLRHSTGAGSSFVRSFQFEIVLWEIMT